MGTVLVIIAVAVIVIFLINHTHTRSIDMIEQWASENGMEVVDAESRLLGRGPFFFTTSRGQTVYFVTFRKDGQTRQAYVRCGSWLGGITFSDQVDVRWVE